MVVADTQETDFGHKCHTGLGVEDPVIQEVASVKLGVVDIDTHLVKVEGRFEVHRLAEYVQDKNAVILEDVEDRSEVDLVDLLEVVARKSELWQEETEVVGDHNHLAAEVEDQLMEVLEGLTALEVAEILFELLQWTVVVVVVVVLNTPRLPVWKEGNSVAVEHYLVLVDMSVLMLMEPCW